MPINRNEGPRLLTISGTPKIEVYSLVHRYNGWRPQVRKTHWRNKAQVNEIAIHHDAVFYSGRDADHDGTTIDEDIARMDADYEAANARLGLNPERMPYHLMGSHERLYLTLDLGVIGAHVEGRNTRTVGICGLGNFTRNWPPLTQIAILGGGVAITARWRGKWITIRGHRALPGQSTVCPGGTVDAWGPLLLRIARGFSGVS